MLFTYWTSQTLDEPPSAGVWREKYPEFRIFHDEDVMPILGSDLRRRIFSEINIPACKSDIARLVLLREYGGLYVDAHAGPTSGEQLSGTLGALASYEMVLFCRSYMDETGHDIHLMNGAYAARRKAPVLDDLINCAFDHLVQHKIAEQATSEHVFYDLFGLAGTWVLLKCFFDMSSKPYTLRPEFKDQIFLCNMTSPESPGFKVYQFHSYKKSGEHWSDRQKTERLFA